MDARAPKDEVERLSDLIGSIYDCVVDPERWDLTLDAMRGLLDCANVILYVADPASGAHRLQRMVGVDPYWAARIERHEADLVALHATVADFYHRPLDEPFVCHADVEPEAWLANGYYRHWAAPQGLVDVIDTIMIRRPDRTASCALCRHETVGLIGDREIRLARLIAPHLRRAVTISDLIDMRSFRGRELAETLDAIAVGIVLVAEDGVIVHANQAAERMFANGAPIRSIGGRLAAGDPVTTDRLRGVAMAARAEAKIGPAGIGMALAVPDQGAATAHVLPLRRGERATLAPRAVAAVFVSSEGPQTVGSLEGIADTFSLTPAETKLLARLVAGDLIDDAAQVLGVTRPTVKTHVARILSKTGSRRQTDLLALVHRLAPPIGAMSGSQAQRSGRG